MPNTANLIFAAFLISGSVSAARLSPAASRAFQEYAANFEARITQRNYTPVGSLRIEPVHGGTWPVPDALLHDWRGSTVAPDVSAAEMLALLRDCRDLPKWYAPEVQSCTLLARQGDVSRVLIRFQKRNVAVVTLDAEYEVTTHALGPHAGYERSVSTHIWEIDNPGTPRERRRPEGNDDGFLWRLNSYWTFAEVSGGLLIECEAVSLTRDVPTGLNWLAAPIIAQLPRQSLEFTLNATAKALLANRKETHR
ncbi:MAG TPA: hypothetical protein VFB14_21000 [Bryobacteraceae bacterium]|jgi:hypothetical protein|nr:hypothetical protein [Bryobacteraceae bacterium]